MNFGANTASLLNILHSLDLFRFFQVPLCTSFSFLFFLQVSIGTAPLYVISQVSCIDLCITRL